MFRKPIYRYLLAGLLIVVLIGVGSSFAYRAGFAQGADFEALPFTAGEDGSYGFAEGYRHMDGYRGFGHMPYGRMGHYSGFGFFSLFGLLFRIFLAILVFKLIFRLIFFPYGMRRRMMHRKMKGNRMHKHPGMWGWYDEDWDDEDDESENAEDDSESTPE